MKIGLDLRMYGTKHGGIGRYCQELFLRILKLDSENKYVVFYNKEGISSEQLAEFKSLTNLELVEANFKHYSLLEQTSFLRLLNKHKLDLVHFPNFNVPIAYNKPFVVTIHDMVHHKISGAKKSRALHFWAYKKVMGHAATAAKKIITVSDYSKREIVKFLNIAEAKIQTIYEGHSLNTDVSEEAVNKVKKSFLLQNPYLLFVGVMERKKNLQNLSRGFDYFLQKYNLKVDLVIAGPVDKHYPDIKHKMLDIKSSANLVFTGFVEDDELRALYKGAYAFVSASLHEGFGLPGVEALSFGLPLLVSNLEVFNEIYDNAAIYFNPLEPADIGEKMNILVRDSQFYEQLQRKSFDRSLMFDWNKAARETLEVYSSVYNHDHNNDEPSPVL